MNDHNSRPTRPPARFSKECARERPAEFVNVLLDSCNWCGNSSRVNRRAGRTLDFLGVHLLRRRGKCTKQHYFVIARVIPTVTWIIAISFQFAIGNETVTA